MFWQGNNATRKIEKMLDATRKDQRTNGHGNANLISWPSKAQNIKTRKIYGKEMTLTFNTQMPS